MEETTTTTTRPQVQKPRLEIPDSKLGGNGSSPRSMHGFPQSPQSPDNSSPASSQVKSFEDWSAQSAVSPGSVVRGDITPGVEKKSLHFYVGEFVLVRCNQSKWLLGQVRRSSRTGLIVWVGVAQTLVNVPYDLLVSHLVKLDSPSQPASPPSSISTESLEVNRCGQLMAPFLCVRPAHLSHRKLYHPLRPRNTNKVHAVSCSVNFHSGHDVGSSRGGKVVHNSSREIVLASQEPAYTPGNIQIIKEFKAESYYGAQVARQHPFVAPPFKASPVAPQSVPGRALCGFKLQQEESVDDSNREEGWLENENQSCWITVIENGLDIRKKPKYQVFMRD